jgi:hypothetical protein
VVNAGHCFFKNLKTLLVQFGGIERHSGQITAGGPKAGHQAAPNRIAGGSDNNRDDRCRTLGYSGGRHADNNDHIGREFDDLGCNRIERLTLFVGKAVLDRNILAVEVAQIAKALLKASTRCWVLAGAK